MDDHFMGKRSKSGYPHHGGCSRFSKKDWGFSYKSCTATGRLTVGLYSLLGQAAPASCRGGIGGWAREMIVGEYSGVANHHAESAVSDKLDRSEPVGQDRQPPSLLGITAQRSLVSHGPAIWVFTALRTKGSARWLTSSRGHCDSHCHSAIATLWLCCDFSILLC